jgi:alanine or glycine:cation symporter, AGCS family
MHAVNAFIAVVNDLIWHNAVIIVVLLTGVLFTLWTRFCQLTSLSHGFALLSGRYADPSAPGAISHFQALSGALSGTVGLGNIGGVAIAVSLGGPGAVFWMWVVGFVGMALKMVEVTLSMLYRNVDDPSQPHGGPMWVARKAFAEMGPGFARVGAFVAGLFCVTLVFATMTTTMFQAWNVGELTETYFDLPGIAAGIVMVVLVALVIIGGIRRIGHVAGVLVPFMLALYVLGGSVVLVINADRIPDCLRSIFAAAFSTADASGAFIGGTLGYAFLFGMKRALFSNEAGQGSSPIMHSAARTPVPVREGIVAGLEPFIDTLVICTFSALVILVSGVWNRAPDARFDVAPHVVAAQAPGTWTLESAAAPQLPDAAWGDGETVYTILSAHENAQTGNTLHKLYGTVHRDERGGAVIEWQSFASDAAPVVQAEGVYIAYVGAALTARAFDSAWDGLGKYLVTLASWLFAVSTMISWGYYGEQGIIYLLGQRAVLPYKIAYLILMLIATTGIMRTATEVDNLTTLGTGIMLIVNIPLTLLFARHAVGAYRDYVARRAEGELP